MKDWFSQKVLGKQDSKTFGDNFRRGWSRLTVVIGFLLLVDLILQGGVFWGVSTASLAIAAMLVVWGIAYFVLVVATIPFLTSHNFRPDAMRLMRDTATSISFNVLSFALLYLQLGIVEDAKVIHVPRDVVYFSAVTFSTLGYGDFSPVQNGRIIASLQAILGNLHLGMTVGVMFFATQTAGKGSYSEENIDSSSSNEDK